MAGPQNLNHREHLPPDPGSYALLLRLPKPARIAVGRLGEFAFPQGQYLYLGSAHGPGGLQARLAHHLRPALRPHWHIDFLRTHAEVRQVWWSVGKEPLECQWSQTLFLLPTAFLPAPGFGASDCRRGCPSHMVGLGESVNKEEILAVLTRSSPAKIESDR